MKNKLPLLMGLLLMAITSSAQKQKKSALFLDSTARKHELQLNVGMLLGPLIVPGTFPSGGFDLTYARVYKGTHYLRTGMGLTSGNSSNIASPDITKLGLPDTMDYTFYKTSRSTMAWGKIGYEISINNRKTRFLFGADLMVGYTSMGYGLSQSYGAPPIDSISYQNLYQDQTDYRGVFVGVNPRASVRYNFSRLFSGGITTGFILGSSIYLSERKWTDPFDDSKFLPTNLTYFELRFKPELNLIFKIP